MQNKTLEFHECKMFFYHWGLAKAMYELDDVRGNDTNLSKIWNICVSNTWFKFIIKCEKKQNKIEKGHLTILHITWVHI